MVRKTGVVSQMEDVAASAEAATCLRCRLCLVYFGVVAGMEIFI